MNMTLAQTSRWEAWIEVRDPRESAEASKAGSITMVAEAHDEDWLAWQFALDPHHQIAIVARADRLPAHILVCPCPLPGTRQSAGVRSGRY
jgi:hypothetical protein